MSHRLSPLQFTAVVTGVMLLVLVALVQLPHDRYIRFQHMAAQSVHYLRAQWIYERIHFDETPIDIAFIGTSHTQCSINAELVEQGLSAAGHPQHVVNFAIPALGRDLHYLLVRELLENRSIKTLVIEVQEGESRAPHPAFDLLSEARDLFTGPLIVNSRFPETLAGLPLRQATLFVQSRFPELFGVAATFNPATYQARWDDTYQIRGFTETRTAVFPAGHFDADSVQLMKKYEEKQALGRKLTVPIFTYSLPYRYNLIYLEKIQNLAREKGVRVVFLYLPFWKGPAQPIHSSMLTPAGRILHPVDILADPSIWQNEEHLNVFGARRISEWVAKELAHD